MQRDIELNIHAVLPCSAVNGPGLRLVVFFQGCTRGCAGCFNPETHSHAPRTVATPAAILADNLTRTVEGLTVSGGEPFDQSAGLAELLRLARYDYGLTIVVYTGYRLDEITTDPARAACLAYIDVLIDGPFDAGRVETTMLARGSTNQTIHLRTDRYTEADLVMPGRVEVIINGEGVVTETGFSKAAVLSN